MGADRGPIVRGGGRFRDRFQDAVGDLHQPPEFLGASGFSPVSPAPDKISLGVTYYHLGGTYFVDNIGKGVYVVGGLGATHFDPGADLSSALRFSLNLGVGYMIPLGQTLAVKLEGRGYVTLVNSSSAFLCSGGCVVQIKGETLTQGEAMAGLVWRF